VFDGARVGEISRRKVDAAVGLFDDETADVAVSEFDGERETHRPGASDEDWDAVRRRGFTHRLVFWKFFPLFKHPRPFQWERGEVMTVVPVNTRRVKLSTKPSTVI
jgi:hypothetical protein